MISITKLGILCHVQVFIIMFNSGIARIFNGGGGGGGERGRKVTEWGERAVPLPWQGDFFEFLKIKMAFFAQ